MQRAKDRWHQLGKPQNVMMASPGMAMCGQGFNEIIIDEPYRPGLSHLQRIGVDEWLEQLHRRMNVNGEWRWLETR